MPCFVEKIVDYNRDSNNSTVLPKRYLGYHTIWCLFF